MSKKKIQSAIDTVEPREDAKERMYQNIMKKAERHTSAQKKSGAVRRSFVRYALPIAACICIAVMGVVHLLPGSTPMPPEDSSVLVGNPFAAADGPEDFKAIGITLDAPAGAENAAYFIIDSKIAVVNFAVNGKKYEARASGQRGDFSGLVGSEEELEIVDAQSNAILYRVEAAGTYYKITWTDGRVNFCLYGTDGAGAAEVRAVYDSMKN